jgi:hypothetical protein
MGTHMSVANLDPDAGGGVDGGGGVAAGDGNRGVAAGDGDGGAPRALAGFPIDELLPVDANPAVLASPPRPPSRSAAPAPASSPPPLLASSSSPGLHCRLNAAPAASPDVEESRPESAT